jgi:hypothetical protein
MLLALLVSFGTMAHAGEWRLPVGIMYISGLDDLADQTEDNLEAEGNDADTAQGLPAGVSFQPYYEFDSGLGLGAGLGPVIFFTGDADLIGIPINVCARYALLPKSSLTPYVRAGVSMPLVNGDYIKDRKPGFLGAVGLEFMRDKIVNMGFEVGYDSSIIEMEDKTRTTGETEEIEPVGFMVSLFAVF